MSKISELLQKVKGKLIFVQLVLFILGKIMFGVVEMPNTKAELDMPHTPFLIIMIIFYSLALTIKLFRNRPNIFSQLLRIEMKCFLLWIITFLSVIF